MRLRKNVIIMFATIVLTVLSGAKIALAEPVFEQWAQIYNVGYDKGESIAIDTQGNVYVLLQIGDWTGRVISYDPDGNLRWMQNSYPVDYDTMAIDSDDNIIVTGDEGSGYMVKYDSYGNVLWNQPFGGKLLTFDNDNNIVIAETAFSPWPPHGRILKINPNGNILWEVTMVQNTSPADLVIDSSGNIIVAGNLDWDIPNPSVNYYTAKYDSAGNLLWDEEYNGPGNVTDYAQSVDVDLSGNVYVTGMLGMYLWKNYDISGDIGTIKYDADGNFIWMRHYGTSSIDANERGVDVEVDPLGNIVVLSNTTITSTQTLPPQYFDHLTTIKYNPDGQVIWLDTLRGAETTPGDMKINNNEDIYITGVVGMPAPNYNDIFTLKYNAMGEILWRMVYNSATYDGPSGMAIDDKNNVYVSGSTQAASSDIITIKYSPVIAITVAPENPQIIIPQSGGTFDYNVSITNNSTATQNISLWIEITSSFSIPIPVSEPINIVLAGGETLNTEYSQIVPANLPIGTYTFTTKVGNYPNEVWDSDSFTFEVQ